MPVASRAAHFFSDVLLPKQALGNPIHMCDLVQTHKHQWLLSNCFLAALVNIKINLCGLLHRKGNWIFWKAINSSEVTVCHLVLVSVLPL